MKWKRCAAAALLLCLLSACSSEEDDQALLTYTFEGDTIPSLEQVMSDKTGGRLVSVLSPETAESGSGEEAASDEGSALEGASDEAEPAGDASASEASPYIAYDYQQFVEGQPASVAQSYYNLLTDSENQLTAEGVGDAAPSFDTVSGSVLLYRQAVQTGDDGSPVVAGDAASESEGEPSEDGEDSGNETDEDENGTPLPYAAYEHDSTMRFRVRIDWTPTSCLITLDKNAGEDFTASLEQAGTLLSFSGAKALMQTVTPSEIGLPGSSMAEYSLKPGPGFVMVDGEACLSVYVYGKTAEDTNTLMGTYFISSDGSTLYRQIDGSTDEVEKITLPARTSDATFPTEGEAASQPDSTTTLPVTDDTGSSEGGAQTGN